MKYKNKNDWKKHVEQNACIKDETHCVVALCAGYSEEEVKALLKRHPTWYRSML